MNNIEKDWRRVCAENNIRVDEREMNRDNKKFGYHWVPDAFVHDFINRQKQKRTLSSLEGLVAHIDEEFNRFESEIPHEFEFSKKFGRSFENMIMWVEQGYPSSASLVAKYKEKLYSWEIEGIIE